MEFPSSVNNPVQMTPRKAPPRRVKFPLFAKIILGFVLIIIFLVISSLFILFQMKEAFSTRKSDLMLPNQTISLSHQIERTFDQEMKAAEAYILTRDPARFQEYTLNNVEFAKIARGLLDTTNGKEIPTRVRDAVRQQARYSEEVLRRVITLQNDRAANPLTALAGIQLMSDSLKETLYKLNEVHHDMLDRTLRRLDVQTEVAMTSGVIVLLLSLTIALVVAIMLTSTIIRPIHALKTGTEKVGEGRFETVPVTTNDEIADLTTGFNSMSEKLRQLDEMRMQMMSEISHEMRSPLQVIKAGCHMITHTKDGPSLNQKQVDAVGMIHQAANRINSFVNSFLDVAKMEAGLMTFQFESTDLLELMTPLIHEAQLIGQTRQVVVEFIADQVPKLPLDRERMTQVFTNLLSNALKYTPDKGSIVVRVTKTNEASPVNRGGRGCVRIDVKDSGVGIPEEDLDKLFNKFYQAQNTPVVNQKGSGLGLALVKHVAEAHGGAVSVSSRLSAGSTFSVILPV
jgi:two-component system sensor histidine kinase GlrK